MEKWIACHENAGIFIGKEKAFDLILNSNEAQRKIFIQDYCFEDILKHALSFYGDESITWNEPAIYLKVLDQSQTCVVNAYGIWIEADSSWSEFLKRLNKTWCIEDDQQHIKWVASCNITPNCVK